MEIQEKVNVDRERSNLLRLVKFILERLIDYSSSSNVFPVFDERNRDVVNLILVLERIINFRMKLNWLSERRFIWEFLRPACLAASKDKIIERVETLSNNQSIKEKGRFCIQYLLMNKILSDTFKSIIVDRQIIRKYYLEDSIISSSESSFLFDQLAGLDAIDFNFCFKSNSNLSSTIDVIDLTDYLYMKSSLFEKFLEEQDKNEKNDRSIQILSQVNELKPLKTNENEINLNEKYKIEVDQRKYLEELVKHRDRELESIKKIFETFKYDREREIRLMENVIIELQVELDKTRTKLDLMRKEHFSNENSNRTSNNNQFHLFKQKIFSIKQKDEQSFDDGCLSRVDPSIIVEQIQSNENIDDEDQDSLQSKETIQSQEEQFEIIEKTSPNSIEDKLDSSTNSISNSSLINIDESNNIESKTKHSHQQHSIEQ